MITRIRLGHTHLSRSVEPGPPKEPPQPTPQPPPAWRRWLLPIGMLILLGLLFWPSLLRSSPTTKYTFTTFQNQVTSGDVKSVSIDSNGAVTGMLTNGKEFTSQLPTALDRSQITQQLNSQHVQITATQAGGGLLETLLPSLIWLILIVGLFVWTGRAAQRQLSGIGGFGRSRAKVIEAERPTTRFSDVAGYDGVKQEISEVVDFLRDPQRYAAAGAQGPRGVLMVGPPGTGKTLIARAVAGEAQVPFLSVTGSAFVELFVGVGASRVRDLFADARRRAPSIIFIDEIDAIGGRRGGVSFGGNDEREQTLNQLLSEMDGFDQTAGVVVIAATNRPESLDPALLRPGRFDRQVVVPLPNQTERAAILAVHAKGKKLAPDVDLTVTARGTPGFSGADLANLINEAAIHAIRDNRTTITAADFDAARDRILLGTREASNVLLPEEKQSVAVHESGHALVAALSPNADPGVEGDHPARGHGARRHPPAARGRTPPLQRGLPDRPARGPAGRAGGRAGRVRARLHRRRERPGRGHPAGGPDGARVRPLPRAGAGRLLRPGFPVPRRPHPGRAAAALLGGDPAGRGPGGLPAAAGGRRAGGGDAERPPRGAGLAGRAADRERDRGRQRRPGSAPRQEAARPPGQRVGSRPARVIEPTGPVPAPADGPGARPLGPQDVTTPADPGRCRP